MESEILIHTDSRDYLMKLKIFGALNRSENNIGSFRTIFYYLYLLSPLSVNMFTLYYLERASSQLVID